MTRPAFISHSKTRTAVLAFVSLLMIAPILSALSVTVRAQASQLSLADILIALRSRKVTLSDRNKILAEAINTRGTTFTLTPEIERELAGGGADRALIDSIKQRTTQIAKAVVPPPTDPKPKTEPPKAEPVVEAPPDAAFYEKRADENVAKGDLDAALVDFTKAIEMKASSVSALMGRGNAHFAKKAYLLAIADFSKVIELEPKNARAIARRADANEKQGDPAAAIEDYKKAFDLDPTLESPKAAVERFNAEQAKLAAQKTEPPPVQQPVAAPPVVVPEFLDLGQLNESHAIRMVKPVYPVSATRTGLGGQVVVDIELDTEGNVTKAKVFSGNAFLRQSSEDAARKSRFKPAMIGDKAVKAKARIVYNFVPQR